MSFNADNLLGFGGLAIGSIATVAMTKEVVGAIKDTANPPRRRMPKRMMKKPMKSRRDNNRYSIESLSRLG